MKAFVFSILFLIASIAHAVEDFADLYEENYASVVTVYTCLLYTSPSPRDLSTSRMPSSA